ncbi:hypothetical protein CesoFtcFv8_001681 [Champsocephalus esox]|uniref:Uncharacterized protein n=1 Tax=Champsocephalus esox TaxID=159716 RepID=A0AAN8D6E3_9TELE|nr:hypothetical protein CesoFtcFv8_001681 [Champsocephalus esox]
MDCIVLYGNTYGCEASWGVVATSGALGFDVEGRLDCGQPGNTQTHTQVLARMLPSEGFFYHSSLQHFFSYS